jgi:hypothetical protein
VSCTVCHRIAAEGLGTPESFTGNFKIGPPGEVYGPYQDVATLPMKNALGVNPLDGQQIKDSALCGSCHTVIVPVYNRQGERVMEDGKPKFFDEQATFYEWRNSSLVSISCAECHMPTEYEGHKLAYKIANIEDNTFPKFEFQAPDQDITLKVRDPYPRHTLLGINVFALEMFGQFRTELGLYDHDPYLPSADLDKVASGQETAIKSSLEIEAKTTAEVGGDGYFKHPKDSWSLNGYFAKDLEGKYAFFQPDYVQFELTPGKGIIRVGSKEYPPPHGETVGIHVLAVNRAHPGDVPLGDTVYSFADLPNFPNEEGTLYFITNVGQPFSSPPSTFQKVWALEMVSLGGTYDLLADAGKGDSYSLVGAVRPPAGLPPYPAAEGGSLLPGKSNGPLRGVLGRERRGNFFSPVASDLVGPNLSNVLNLDFFSILGQSPKPFPVPANDGEQQAFNCIAGKLADRTFKCTEGKLELCQGCNPRDGYWNTNIDIDAWKSTLESRFLVPARHAPRRIIPGVQRKFAGHALPQRGETCGPVVFLPEAGASH